ncbi:cytochrome c biogenesis protein [Corynebacterium mustelae]|uniref:Cytochrome c biogenesis protein n=1 Tax=Corynebacterium mustelae TaxID=571915 RepID=A0A0G3GU13_9CORY|nr:cytochrome c biogenesis protein CcdA [Corynebacterium mustelae]AKK04616.1 cytochrome c biogenesis protein [Corynebacterium mustelae]
MIDIGILGAFIGGILALLSPCSALLLPAFFAYAFSTATQLIARTTVFFLGLASVLVPIGVGAGIVGSFFTTYRDTLITAGGVVVIILGAIVFFGGGFRIGPTMAPAGTSRGSTFLLGALYGFSGFCTGPLLGAVLTTAVVGGGSITAAGGNSSENLIAASAYGALILAAYGLGMTVPLFGLALVWDKWNVSQWRPLRGSTQQFGPLRLHTTSMLSGGLMILVGALFLFFRGGTTLPSVISVDSHARIQEWVLVTFGPVSDVVVAIFIGLAIAGGLVAHILRNSSAGATDSFDSK